MTDRGKDLIRGTLDLETKWPVTMKLQILLGTVHHLGVSKVSYLLNSGRIGRKEGKRGD